MNYDPEYLFLECETCNVSFDIIVENQQQIDDCISESGHNGHRFSLSSYEEYSEGDETGSGTLVVFNDQGRIGIP